MVTKDGEKLFQTFTYYAVTKRRCNCAVALIVREEFRFKISHLGNVHINDLALLWTKSDIWPDWTPTFTASILT